jgi:hypothetical protein
VKVIEEEWRPVEEFSNYHVSNFGNIYNVLNDHPMRTSVTSFGHKKITLLSEWDGRRYTRSVAQLVAQAFVIPPNIFCDQIIVLDGDFNNVAAYNLAWRPRWFAWKYTRQLKTPQPLHYRNLPVDNIVNDEYYENIIQAGMTEGLLFDDIWRSTYSGDPVFPHNSVFEVVEIDQRV